MFSAAASVQDTLLAAAEAALAGIELPSGETVDPAADSSWLQQRLLDQARQCIAGWHRASREQLARLLAAEQLCPAQEGFAQLRQQLQQLALLGAVAEGPSADMQPSPEVAAGTPVSSKEGLMYPPSKPEADLPAEVRKHPSAAQLWPWSVLLTLAIAALKTPCIQAPACRLRRASLWAGWTS